MVTELTENLKLLLLTDDLDQQELGLKAMGYNETEEDFNKLKELVKPFGWLARSTKDYYAEYLVNKMNPEPPENPYAFEEVYILSPWLHVTR
jgi:hypothetical protein